MRKSTREGDRRKIDATWNRNEVGVRLEIALSAMMLETEIAQSGHIVLYDGVCGLCNRLVRFILERDKGGRFMFASLQSPFAQTLLAKHGKAVLESNTLYVLTGSPTGPERLLARAEAVTFVLRQLGGVWRATAVFGIVPTFLLNLAYDFVARHRYRVFGKYSTCPLPSPEYRGRFIDV